MSLRSRNTWNTPGKNTALGAGELSLWLKSSHSFHLFTKMRKYGESVYSLNKSLFRLCLPDGASKSTIMSIRGFTSNEEVPY